MVIPLPHYSMRRSIDIWSLGISGIIGSFLVSFPGFFGAHLVNCMTWRFPCAAFGCNMYGHWPSSVKSIPSVCIEFHINGASRDRPFLHYIPSSSMNFQWVILTWIILFCHSVSNEYLVQHFEIWIHTEDCSKVLYHNSALLFLIIYISLCCSMLSEWPSLRKIFLELRVIH